MKSRLEIIKENGIKLRDDCAYLALFAEAMKDKTDKFLEQQGINKRIVSLILALTAAIGGTNLAVTNITERSIQNVLREYNAEDLKQLDNFYKFKARADQCVYGTKSGYADEFSAKDVKIYQATEWGKTRIYIYIDNDNEPICTMEPGWDGLQADKLFQKETGYTFDEYRYSIEYLKLARVIGDEKAKKVFDGIIEEFKSCEEHIHD